MFYAFTIKYNCYVLGHVQIKLIDSIVMPLHE